MLKGKFPLPVALAVAAMFVAPLPARAADAEVPYWVSLRKDTSNMRVGPGLEYRVSWIYKRKGLPLKVLRVMGGWRLVEDVDGARGWMLARFLTRTHTGVVRGTETAMREANDGSGKLLWRVAPGVVGKLGDCSPGWCKFDIDGKAGYIPAGAVWGSGAP